MNKRDFTIALVLLLLCAAFCGLFWFMGEGRRSLVDEARAAPVPTPVLLAPQTTSAIVTSVSQPVGFTVTVPHLKNAIDAQKSSGNVRVTFEFPKEKAQWVSEHIAPGATYHLEVRSGR